jgi:alpha-galactosidase
MEALNPAQSFSFIFNELAFTETREAWITERRTEQVDLAGMRETRLWTEPRTGLQVALEMTRFAGFPAVDWLVWFENTGAADTPIVRAVNNLDVWLQAPLADYRTPYFLHRTNGAPADPSDFAHERFPLTPGNAAHLGGGGGRSSYRDFPFFKIETGQGALLVAVGWSGQWRADIGLENGGVLHVTAGLEACHFRLHPGERVRTPRILALTWPDNSWEANAQFRQLIHQHYAARRDAQTPLPTAFCNTCFTRDGAWLNECNAENQISLIRACAGLGMEAVVTDAGWFEGGWPQGAGNWNPRRDAYPDGMAPVARAAQAAGIGYGLWFEPERVVAGTALHRRHPEWCLAAGHEPQARYLLNFGLPEVRRHFFAIVKPFMDLPGFAVYRQDFNLDPLPYWRFNEAPDRQGIVEMKYIEGLYAWWDSLAAAWPASLREECASGGRRIDLETIQRMHLHQDSDYWFDNDVDQAQIWGLSQYLPNNAFVSHLNRLDDYSFHSTLAASLCLGWIADAPDFDAPRARHLLDVYRRLRHLLVGAWYPLLPYSRDPQSWLAMQWHRSDLDEGLVLVFRRAQSPLTCAEFRLNGLRPGRKYTVAEPDQAGPGAALSGEASAPPLAVELPLRPMSRLLHYRGEAG